MERELPGYSVVNFGMYAALGTTVMLDLSEPLIREGDIVILIPEQQGQALSGWFDPAVMWQGLDGAYGLLGRLPREKLARLAGAFPEFAGQKFSWFLQGGLSRIQSVYRRDSFNQMGDVSSPLCSRNEMPGGFDAGAPICFAPDMMAGEWFYDTNFHPNSSGKTVYTRLLIRSIKAMMGDSSPTEIALPTMPEMAETARWDGDDSDGACFTYEEISGALTVVGLTPEGAARTALTMPCTWEGQPVPAIGPGAFRGAEGLSEITIQPNIGTIADGAFSGCPALERIIMESDIPSACRVGQGLLDGTAARVYVPEEALSAYRTDYFWSVHGSSVQPGERTGRK